MHIIACEDKLCQGDLFRFSIALPRASAGIVLIELSETPLSDNMGSVTHCSIEIASQGDGTIAPGSFRGRGRPTANATYPVVVHAALFDYFVIASQTCDVSGDGKLPLVCIAPFQTLGQLMATEPLPLKPNTTKDSDRNEWQTINEYLAEAHRADFSDIDDVDALLPERVRQFVSEGRLNGTKEAKKDLGRVKSMYDDFLAERKWIYYLPPSQGPQIPEGYVDLRQIYTVELTQLEQISDRRIAALRGNYREHFSKHLGDLLSRVAVLQQLKPPRP